ncbi:hypothetical protein MUP77_13740 [Candidatus Bathyarchaeota archaeon]|nr:hypothetical protein [Candidatus Bathyarchaeota archaeon]
MNKNFKNITVHKSTYDMAHYLAKVTGKSMSSILDELVSNVFQVGMNFKTLNLEYEISILNNTITIHATGKSTFTIGSISEEEWNDPEKLRKNFEKRIEKE